MFDTISLSILSSDCQSELALLCRSGYAKASRRGVAIENTGFDKLSLTDFYLLTQCLEEDKRGYIISLCSRKNP
jgi:hypothetical protein